MLDRRANRNGSTSPVLICVEPNPGPKRKATRRCAKKPRPTKRVPKVDEITKGKIAMGVDLGLSREKIANQLDRTYPTIQRWADRYESTGKMDRKVGSGRPRKTMESDDRFLCCNAKETGRRLQSNFQGQSRTRMTRKKCQPGPFVGGYLKLDFQLVSLGRSHY